MELLEQCKTWNDDGEYESVVDALEILPENARTPEMDSELARAYNNLGEPGEYKLFAQALELLKPHEEYFRGNHKYYFRLAYSYYYLDEDGLALHYFKKALDSKPGDSDTIEMMTSCADMLSESDLRIKMSERVSSMWEDVRKDINKYNKLDKDFYSNALAVIAKGIKEISKRTDAHITGDRAMELEAGDDKSYIFMLQYVIDVMPVDLRELFDIRIGISPKTDIPDTSFFNDREYDITGLRFFVSDDRQIVIYADEFDMPLEVFEKLFIDIFGEIDLMANDFEFDFADKEDFDAPNDETCSIVLKFKNREDFLKECVDYRGLRACAEGKGARLGINAKDYLKMYSGYQLPSIVEDEIREDIYTGTTCLPSLVSEYMSSNLFDKMPIMDELYRNGVSAGFFCFSIDQKKYSDDMLEYDFEIMNLRNQLIEYIMKRLKEKNREHDIAFLEGATGKKYGYLDFLIFGSFMLIMNTACDFFEKNKIPFAGYKTFRKISKIITFVED